MTGTIMHLGPAKTTLFWFISVGAASLLSFGSPALRAQSLTFEQIAYIKPITDSGGFLVRQTALDYPLLAVGGVTSRKQGKFTREEYNVNVFRDSDGDGDYTTGQVDAWVIDRSRRAESIALQGDLLAVATTKATNCSRGAKFCGIIDVYRLQGNSWTLISRLTNVERDQELGTMLAIDGDTIVATTAFGEVVIYRVPGGDFSKIDSNNGKKSSLNDPDCSNCGIYQVGDFRGGSSSSVGNALRVFAADQVIAVGDSTLERVVILEDEDRNGNWSDGVSTTLFSAFNAQGDDRFGGAIDLAKSTSGEYVLAVGAWKMGGDDVNDPFNNNVPTTGAAYIIETINGGDWSQAQTTYIKASMDDNLQGLRLGTSLALDALGERLIVGAGERNPLGDCINNPVHPLPGGGRVFHFELDPGTGVWSQVESFRGANTECAGAEDNWGIHDNFGWFLTFDSDWGMLMVFAFVEDGSQTSPPIGFGPLSPDTDDDSAPGRGAVYQFNLVGQ